MKKTLFYSFIQQVISALLTVAIVLGAVLSVNVPKVYACYTWQVGNRVGLKGGAEIRTGSGLGYPVHTTVPNDNWQVDIIDGPRYADGEEWWDISREQIDGGGTGWVYISQAGYDICNPNPPGNIYVVSGLELQPDPSHDWPPVEGDKLIGRFTLGNNGGQTVHLEGYGVRMRRNGSDYWDFLYPGGGVDLAPGQTIRFDQNNERPLATGHYRAEITWKVSGQDWQVTDAQEFDVAPRPGNIYVVSGLELQPDPSHDWPPVEGDKLIGRFTLGNNGGQTVHLEGYGVRMRRNGSDYWDFLYPGGGVDLAPGQTVRFDQNNERPLATGHYRAEITWKVSGQDWQVALPIEFDVAPPLGDDASLIGQSGDPVVQPDQPVQVSFDLQNTGGTTWTSVDNYHLKNVNGIPLGAPNRIDLANSVSPQQTHRWILNLLAPSNPGTYHTEWRMMHGDTTFGPLMSADITVTDVPGQAYDLRLTSAIALNPSPPSAGQPVTARYTLHNFDSQTAYLRLLGVGGRGPNGDGDIQDYPWLQNVSVAPNADLVFEKTRGFAQSGVHTFFPVYQLADGTWHEMKLQSGESARRYVTISDVPQVLGFDIRYQDDSREVMLVTVTNINPLADGSVSADVNVRNPKNIPTMMSVLLFGNVSQPSGYLEKASRIDTIPVGPNSTVTFDDVRFYPGSRVQFRFAAFGYGAPEDWEFLAAYHLTEILVISVFGFIPNGDLYVEFKGLLDGGLALIADALKSVNLDWFNFGQKLGRGDILGALKDLPGIAEHYSAAIANLTGKILRSPLPAATVKKALKRATIFLGVLGARPYLRDLLQAHGYAQADIIPSTRSDTNSLRKPILGISTSTAAVDPANLSASINGAVTIATSSEHTSGWEQHRMIDGYASLGWGSGGSMPVGEWNTIRLANRTPALISSIRINPGPAGGDPSEAALRDFHIDASIDGVNFTTILTGNFTSTELGQIKTFTPQPMIAEYIRIVVDSNQGNGNPSFASVAELDIRGTTYSLDDDFEPDASCRQATLVDTEGVLRQHTFSYPGDVDWIQFEAQAGISYTIQTSNLGTDANTVLELYDQDGSTLLASDDDSGIGLASQIEWIAPATGVYCVMVKHRDSNVSGGGTGYQVSVQEKSRPGDIYLPIILKHQVFGPDLVVDSLVATSDAVTVTIRNQGNVPVTDEFWVDVYFNPTEAPSLNHPWDTIASHGVVWGVTTPIAANGGTLTLTTGDAYYVPEYSSTPPLPVGANVYALVDSINYNTTYGVVLESKEDNNLFGPVTSTASVAGEAPPVGGQGQSPSMEGLPPRR